MGDSPKVAQEPVLPAVVDGKKRVFAYDTRCEIVRFHDSLPSDGSKGAYLRRSGLFKSSVRQWRVDMLKGTDQAKQRGRKTTDPTTRELARLRAEVERLARELERANAVIDVQKKVSALLEMHLEHKEQVS
jgi:transposase